MDSDKHSTDVILYISQVQRAYEFAVKEFIWKLIPQKYLGYVFY